MRSIKTPYLTHLKVSKLFGGEGPIGVSKLDFCLIKLLLRFSDLKIAVNDMLIPENNYLPLYNNFLGGLANCEKYPLASLGGLDMNLDSCWEHLEVESES
jgi:hypothetical protein